MDGIPWHCIEEFLPEEANMLSQSRFAIFELPKVATTRTWTYPRWVNKTHAERWIQDGKSNFIIISRSSFLAYPLFLPHFGGLNSTNLFSHWVIQLLLRIGDIMAKFCALYILRSSKRHVHEYLGALSYWLTPFTDFTYRRTRNRRGLTNWGSW